TYARPMPISGTSSSGSVWNSESVEGDVQRYPDGVDKVPVQDRPFGAEVIAGRKLAHESSNQHADQHQHADSHVQPVEAGQAVEVLDKDRSKDYAFRDDKQDEALPLDARPFGLAGELSVSGLAATEGMCSRAHFFTGLRPLRAVDQGVRGEDHRIRYRVVA